MGTSPVSEPMPAIRTHGLSKRYGRRLAVDGLDLTVPAGEIVGFLGPNGAGKTTTIAMLLGLVRPSAGRMTILGLDAARERPRLQRRVGALLEGPAFYWHLSARDNLRLLARLGRLDAAGIPALLARLGLEEAAGQPARDLSLGQRQRLGLAAALLGEPALLILDEPTNGLDPAGVQTVTALLRDLVARGGAVFFSSHRLEEVRALCTSLAILRAGRLVAQGRVDDLLRGLPPGGLRLRVDDAGRAAAVLAAAGFEAAPETSPNGAALRVRTAPERGAAVNALLTAAGVAVAELRVEAPDLEDLFRGLTGGADG